MTVLLDGNVLVALVVESHVHHGAARAWWAGLEDRYATSPITQGTLLRFLLRAGLSATASARALADLCGDARHDLWTDDEPYTAETLAGVVGHRQVTDAYLASQARLRGGRLATFDRGLAAQHPDVAVLVPS